MYNVHGTKMLFNLTIFQPYQETWTSEKLKEKLVSDCDIYVKLGNLCQIGKLCVKYTLAQF